ncbi:hypothetical protein ACH5RR_004206 [Cinchona calisaya]|uniref:Uncharacterized protein n=1 Tax=Cinchona calisaya TaxID=153742 RepID=A0ABD3AX89_9GENT
MFDHDLKDGGKSVDMTSNTVIYPGQVGYFMSRFLITWNPSRKMPYELSFSNDTNYDKELEVGRQQYCNSCVVDHENIAEIRSMVDSDWLYLGKLSKSQNMENSPEQPLSSRATEQEAGKIKSWSEFVKLSVKRALQSLKFIPVSAR